MPQCLLLSLMHGAGASAARRCRGSHLMRMPSAVSWFGAGLCGKSHCCLPGSFHARGAPCPALRASFGTMWGLCDCDGLQAHAAEHLGASPRVVAGLRLLWAPCCETIGPLEPQLWSGSRSGACVTAQSVTQWAWRQQATLQPCRCSRLQLGQLPAGEGACW